MIEGHHEFEVGGDHAVMRRSAQRPVSHVESIQSGKNGSPKSWKQNVRARCGEARDHFRKSQM
jgi:hypothetical protein